MIVELANLQSVGAVNRQDVVLMQSFSGKSQFPFLVLHLVG